MKTLKASYIHRSKIRTLPYHPKNTNFVYKPLIKFISYELTHSYSGFKKKTVSNIYLRHLRFEVTVDLIVVGGALVVLGFFGEASEGTVGYLPDLNLKSSMAISPR